MVMTSRYVRVSSVSEPDARRHEAILVADPVGTAFRELQAISLPLPLFRTTRAIAVTSDLVSLVMFCCYEEIDWSALTPFAAATPSMLVVPDEVGVDALEAISRGFVGYIAFTLDPAARRRSILGALVGEPAFRRGVIGEYLRKERLAMRTDALRVLTPRQRQIIRLVARGAADKEIGRALSISTATAQKHVANMLHRLGVPNRAAAVARAADPSGYVAVERAG